MAEASSPFLTLKNVKRITLLTLLIPKSVKQKCSPAFLTLKDAPGSSPVTSLTLKNGHKDNLGVLLDPQVAGEFSPTNRP